MSLKLAVLAIAGLLASLTFGASPAAAGTATGWLPLYSFKATETPVGALGNLSPSEAIAVDSPRSSLYAVESMAQPGDDPLVLDKFDLEGKPTAFAATGTSWIPLDIEATPDRNLAEVAVDSYGPNAGRIYVLSREGVAPAVSQTLLAFNPAGELLWKLDSGLEHACGLSVDLEGHPWIARTFNSNEAAIELAASGAPPAKIGSLGGFTQEVSPCQLGFDANGRVFAARRAGQVLDVLEGQVWRDFGAGPIDNFTIDQSDPDGHMFTKQERNSTAFFSEYSATGDLLATGGEGLLAYGRSIAYDSILDRVFVTRPSNEKLPEGNSSEIAVFGRASGTVPDVTLGSVVSTGSSGAHLTGTVNPDGVENSWHFEWKEHGQAWLEAKASPVESLPADEVVHEVSYDPTSLTGGVIYDVRLIAVNTALGLRAVSGEKTFSSIPATVDTLPATLRTDTSVRLNARIDPAGNQTTYRFEFSPDGASWTPLPQRPGPAGIASEVVGEVLAGLQPDTIYRYRVSAEGPLGPSAAQGGEMTFRTRTTAEMGLPRRGNELISTPDKGNQNVLILPPAVSPMSPGGDRAVWSVSGGAPGGQSGVGNVFLSERTAAGWRSRALAPPASEQIGGGASGYGIGIANPDLTKFVGLATDRDASVTLLRLDDRQNQSALTEFSKGTARIAGYASVQMTTDGAHVVELNSDTSLLEDVGSGSSELVGLMPDGEPPACGLSAEGESFGSSRSQRAGAGRNWRPGYKMIATTDASRVYFQAKANGKCGGVYGLYVRNRESGETTLIDAKDPHFIRATADGRSAFFTTKSKLDPVDTDSGNDVYRWDEGAEASSCLTCIAPAAAAVDDATRGVLVSDDFSHVYFQTAAELLPEAPKGVDGLYALSEGELHFVAPVGLPQGQAEDATLSADGETLLLRAPASRILTADHVAALCPDLSGVTASAPCQELYRYDDRDGAFECLSCDSGETTNSVGSPASDSLSDFRLSPDGGTAAFVTSEALLPVDVNGDSDVYEWHQGALQLVTDGLSEFPSGQAAPQVYAVTPGGRDIFFSVAAPGLTGFERDGLASAYDARVGGGFEVPPPPLHCSEEACQGPLQSAPGAEHPGSAAVVGAGNLTQKTKRGRCAHTHGKKRQRCLSRHKRHGKTRQGGKR